MAEHQRCLRSQEKAYELVIPWLLSILYTYIKSAVALYQQ